MTKKIKFTLLAAFLFSMAAARLALSQVAQQSLNTTTLIPINPIGVFSRVRAAENVWLASGNCPCPEACVSGSCGNARIGTTNTNNTYKLHIEGAFGLTQGSAGPLRFGRESTDNNYYALFAP